jgi:hypothetical protein
MPPYPLLTFLKPSPSQAYAVRSLEPLFLFRLTFVPRPSLGPASDVHRDLAPFHAVHAHAISSVAPFP